MEPLTGFSLTGLSFTGLSCRQVRTTGEHCLRKTRDNDVGNFVNIDSNLDLIDHT